MCQDEIENSFSRFLSSRLFFLRFLRNKLRHKIRHKCIVLLKLLIKDGDCSNGKGTYNKVKSSHSSKVVAVTIQTNLSPHPNNGYPTQRAINLKPGQLRILGCLMVNEGPDKAASSVSHKVVNATFP